MPAVPQPSVYPQDLGCLSIPEPVVNSMSFAKGPEIAGMFAVIRRARQANVSTETILALHGLFPKRIKFVRALHTHIDNLEAAEINGPQPEPSTPGADVAVGASLQLFSANGEAA